MGPNSRRIDWMWNDVDEWGWKAGFEFPPGLAAEQARMIATCRETYRPLFTNYRIAPTANRASSRGGRRGPQRGAAVGFVFLPESRMFRSWYTPEAERQAREHLAATCRDLAIPLINARDWMADDLFVDGFHLTRRGAAEFTTETRSGRRGDIPGDMPMTPGLLARVRWSTRRTPSAPSRPVRRRHRARASLAVGCFAMLAATIGMERPWKPGSPNGATRSLAIA